MGDVVKACKKAKIKATPRQLRYALATFLVGDEVGLKMVQLILAHSKIATTLDMYTDGSEQGRDAAREALARRNNAA
ncbi:tyrosine-type recombinase/integrase [Actinomadura rubteroloni]|uniref:tyrosine-type recombinase/integrase n=1 Tax=Actinomadura rubteroloni TaxID=1926885 RepID=UPI00143DFC63|nr:tyrosine-type recombinase/integrase [Actinomadura rubteroloni]